jgi:hypothetical protein
MGTQWVLWINLSTLFFIQINYDAYYSSSFLQILDRPTYHKVSNLHPYYGATI